MVIYFDTLHLYYLTQYLPVFRELKKRGVESRFVFYRNLVCDEPAQKVIEQEDLPALWVNSEQEAAFAYKGARPEWVVFGNMFPLLKQLHPDTRTAQLYHGIGMKSDVYQPGLMEMDIRFVEGPHYTEELSRLYPGKKMLEVGYAKLDPLFGAAEECPVFGFEGAGLDPARPTLLYAPTFYPSSIEMMPDDLPDHFSDYNLIVKPHMFSWSKKRYSGQRRKLRLWSEKPNCYLPDPHDFNLLPFMHAADLMISDASSALFEFAATDKPIIWCDFLKLRWTYRWIFRYRLRRRLDESICQYADISAHASGYGDLPGLVDEQLRKPETHSEKRRAYTRRLLGPTDGRVSERVVDYLTGGLCPVCSLT